MHDIIYLEEGIVNIENLFIATAHPEFSRTAIAELQRLDKNLSSIEELEPGVILCSASDVRALTSRAARERPVFVRHLAPVQTMVNLTNEARDIGAIATPLAALPTFSLLERGIRFSVQSRLVQFDKKYGERPYSSGQLNQALAEAIAEETGAIEAIKKPQIVVSILCTMRKGYLGISPVEENLSDWPGGNRHYAQLPEQISRAEFKLLEALEVFGVTLPPQGRALDLGAAPGGWTRLLLEAGLHVVAVDPASLDPRLAQRKGLEHYRGYAQQYIEEAIKQHTRFAVIVNDMRMDARGAARLLARAARCLIADGFVVSVFKLPHATDEINPLTNFREALSILGTSYGIVQARQLFHNRQEVTVLAARPLSPRAR
jgi:23S rRNA (cytidine2498-2'-O)-methyltransferase